jgi:hypothetical protein
MRDQPVGVVLQQQALGDERRGRLLDLLDIGLAAAVALLERGAGVAGGVALGLVRANAMNEPSRSASSSGCAL